MLPTKFRFIWPSGFRGEYFKKSANQKQELPMVAMFVNGSGQNEQYLERTFHRCFLPSFTSFGWGVSEEKIKMWKVNGRRTSSDGKSSHCLWQGELKSDYIRGVASLARDNLVVSYYLDPYENWPDWRVGISWEWPYNRGNILQQSLHTL